jgi:hypothetical protein
MQEHFTMSKKELDRAAMIMNRIAERRLRQSEAGRDARAHPTAR